MDRRRFILTSTAAGLGIAPGIKGLTRRPGRKSSDSGWPSYIGGTAGGPIVPWSAYVPDGTGPFPGVIVLHGGQWVSGTRWDTQDECNVLKDAGYTAMTLDYTLATAETPGYPVAVDDVIRFGRWCQTQTRFKLAHPYRLGILGNSAGGTIAHEVGMRAAIKPTSIATLSGIQNLLGSSRSLGLDAYIGCDPDVCNGRWTKASPLESATSDQPTTLLMNSTDEIVPASDPEAYQAKLTDLGVSCDLKLYPGRLHGSMLLERAKADFIAFFDSTLKA